MQRRIIRDASEKIIPSTHSASTQPKVTRNSGTSNSRNGGDRQTSIVRKNSGVDSARGMPPKA